MILLFLQIAAVVAVGLYLLHWRRENQRRNNQSWDSLIARLSPEWSGREICDKFLWEESLTATPGNVWQRTEGPKGLWVMYKNAQVMLEMASFASRHDNTIDPVLLANLRSDALQIKVCVLTALCQYAFTKASEGTRVNAYRTAQMYAAMSARMTLVLQNHAALVLPDFVAAM